mgnify:CR=1 FL=1
MVLEFPAIIAEYQPEGEHAAVEFTMLAREDAALFLKKVRALLAKRRGHRLCVEFFHLARRESFFLCLYAFPAFAASAASFPDRVTTFPFPSAGLFWEMSAVRRLA